MLDVGSKELWEEEVKESVVKVVREVKGDEILIGFLENLLNHVDSDIISGKPIAFRFERITDVLNKPRYFDRFRDSAELHAVQDLAEKLNTIGKVARYEEKLDRPSAEPSPIRNRLPSTPGDVRDIYGMPKGNAVRKRL